MSTRRDVLAGRRQWSRRDRWRLALGGGMVVTGVAHLVEPTPFVRHLPLWVPERELLVAVSGIAEIGLGAARLASHPYRHIAGGLLALFLVASATAT